MKKENWIWMPHAGHFICGHRCQFKLNTYVGKYIVSTIGELPLFLEKPKGDDYMSQFETVGLDRYYETMVFKAMKSEHKCCPYEIIVEHQVDFEGYNTAEEASKGHIKLCNKWSK